MMSPLQKKRREYLPIVPPLLRHLKELRLQQVKTKRVVQESIRKLFPNTCDQSPYLVAQGVKNAKALRIGVVFSGGPAAGGHNVIAGIWDALQQFGEESLLIGFLDGPSGIIESRSKILTKVDIETVRNQGGFDLIGSGRTKIDTKEQMASALKTCQGLKLDGLVVIGGDDSNTNAAVLAEYFIAQGFKISVVGVPKTIDGDLRSQEIEISFGFDSACKTYAEMIGNLARDTLSMKKYIHFVKLMGRSASHITLECALATQPNLALIGEEQKSLSEIVEKIADLIHRRVKAGKEYGIILIPEGLIEFIPEMKQLIEELNRGTIRSSENQAFFQSLPENIQKQLLSDRDPHGNVALSQIETEELLIELVKKVCPSKFTPVAHFYGYEGRSCLPTNFDANYCYTLGLLASLAVKEGVTGVICSVQNLAKKVEAWTFQYVPIVQLMKMEMRKGVEKPVIEKALVNLQGKPFLEFSKMRTKWELEDAYLCPGPIQFFGDALITDLVPRILACD